MREVLDCGHFCSAYHILSYRLEGDDWDKHRHTDYKKCCKCNYDDLIAQAHIMTDIDSCDGDHYEDTNWNIKKDTLERKVEIIKKLVWKHYCPCIEEMKRQDEKEEFEDFFRRR